MGRLPLLVIGLAVCVAAAALMLADVVDVGWGSVIGVIGLGIITAAGRGTDFTR